MFSTDSCNAKRSRPYTFDNSSFNVKRVKSQPGSHNARDNKAEHPQVATTVAEGPPLATVSGLGHMGPFAIWRPDHVVLESIEGNRLSIAKADLIHSSKFFESMFELPTPCQDSTTPIPTFVETRDLYDFLAIVEDQNSMPELRTYVHEGRWVNIPPAISKMWYEERLRLFETADRFDCEAIVANVMLSLEIYYSSLGGLDLLTVASKSNSIPLAKRAIIKMADGPPTISRFEWWTLISHLQPSWQIELTKLVWEFRSELVKPLHQETPDATQPQQDNGWKSHHGPD